jgi:hypothetical protein
MTRINLPFCNQIFLGRPNVWNWSTRTLRLLCHHFPSDGFIAATHAACRPSPPPPPRPRLPPHAVPLSPSVAACLPCAVRPPSPPFAARLPPVKEFWVQLGTKMVRLRALFCAMPSPRRKNRTRIIPFICNTFTHFRAPKRSECPWLRIPLQRPFFLGKSRKMAITAEIPAQIRLKLNLEAG